MKFSCSFTLATFQMLGQYVWLVARKFSSVLGEVISQVLSVMDILLVLLPEDAAGQIFYRELQKFLNIL